MGLADGENTQSGTFGDGRDKKKKTVQDLSLISAQYNWMSWRYNLLKYETLKEGQVWR